MKIQVDVTKSTVEKREVEVEFPLYLKYAGDSENWRDYTTITRMLADGKCIEIHRQEGYIGSHPEYEISAYRKSVTSIGQYVLAKDEYDYSLTTRTEFDELLHEIASIVNEAR
jgi:hypothetical protein